VSDEPIDERQRTPGDMRGSRGLWLTFALAVAAALVLLPLGIARSRANASPAATQAPSAVRAGWTTYTPQDGSFQVLAPSAARLSTLSTGIGPARRVEFGDGSMSVTWLTAPIGSSDASALQAGKESLLRPLVGRLADEEVDLVDDGHPGFGLLITIEGTSYDVRLFAANGRLFQVVGQAPAGSPQVADATAFVDSFRLGSG
jgi:hypothetical protein